MTPATFVFESARRRTWDDGTTALILTGHTNQAVCDAPECAGMEPHPVSWPVSVTVFLGRGDDTAENIAAITRTLGGEA